MSFVKRLFYKFLLALLVVILAGLSLAGTAQAAEVNDAVIRQTLQALEILAPEGQAAVGFDRAAFARMLIQSSSSRNSISAVTTISPYADVSFRHPEAGYIRAATQAGYLSAYTDGKFHPEEAVNASTALRSLLALLGYSREQYGVDHWQFAVKLGLIEGLNIGAATEINQIQANRLFYNALKAVSAGGKTQIENLGFTITNGVIDMQKIIDATAKGPLTILSANWMTGTGLKAEGLTVYRNDALSNAEALQTYDVLYYNAAMNTIWAYSNKVSGVYKSADPSRLSPTSVNVSGMDYALSDAAAAKLTAADIEYGETLILLQGGGGVVADILRQNEIVFDVTGFATAVEKIVDTDSDGSDYNGYTLTLITVDGSALTYEVRRNYSSMVGRLVKLSYSNGEIGVVARQASNISGVFDAANMRLGEHKLAADASILEVYSNGSYDIVYPGRLDGLKLDSGQVLHQRKNAAGEIAAMFISNVTGDALQYGIITNVSETRPDEEGTGGLSGSYSYVLNGKNSTASTSGYILRAEKGPVTLVFKDGKLESQKPLSAVKSLTLHEGGYALDKNNERYLLGAGVSVYQYSSGEYKLLSLKQARELDTTFTGYYDKPESSGGRLRVLIAD